MRAFSKALLTQKTIVLEQKEHVIGQVFCYVSIIDHVIIEHAEVFPCVLQAVDPVFLHVTRAPPHGSK